MIGKSLPLCVRDIIAGTVELTDIERIVTSTFYTDRAMFHSGIHDYCRTYWRDAPGLAHRVAMQLWDEGRLDQPRTRGEPVPDISSGHWEE
jgi:hypothetical protein